MRNFTMLQKHFLFLLGLSLFCYNAYSMQSIDELQNQLKQQRLGYRHVLSALVNDCAVEMNDKDILAKESPEYRTFLGSFKDAVKRDLKNNLARENQIDATTGVEYNAIVLRQTEQFLRPFYKRLLEKIREDRANYSRGFGSGFSAGAATGFVAGAVFGGIGVLCLIASNLQGRVFNP